MIAVREFSSGAECIAHARTLKNKLFAQQTLKPAVEKASELVKVSWNPRERSIAAQVRKPVKRRLIEMETVKRVAKSLPPRHLNIWEKHPTDFNAHVISYRRHLLKVEMESSGEASVLDTDTAGQRKQIIDIVIEVLNDFPDITVADVRGRRRNRYVVLPRQICMYEVCMQREDLSLPVIGRWFGRDHTTILHSRNKIAALKTGQLVEGEEIGPVPQGESQ